MAVTVAELTAVVDADVSGFESKMGSVNDTINKLAGGAALMKGAQGLGNWLGDVTRQAAEFEQQISGIAAVGGREAVERLDEIRQHALDLGADTSFSAGEAAGAIEEMLKAGVPLEAVLGGATKGAMDLAAATGTAVPRSAEIMAQAMQVFGDQMAEGNYQQERFTTAAEQSIHVADLFAGAANQTAADTEGLGQALGNVGPVAAGANQDLETTIATLAALSDYGIQGAESGTQLKTVLTKLQAPTDKAAQLMSDYGIEVRDVNGEMKDLTEIAGELADFQASVDTETFDNVMKEIFGTYGILGGRILADIGEEGLAKIRDGINEAGAAGEAAETRLDNFMGSIEKMQGAMETAIIGIGSGIADVLRPVVDAVTAVIDAFNMLPPSVQGAIGVFAAVGTAVAAAAAALLLLPSAIGPISAAFGALGAVLSGPVLAGLAAVGAAIAAYQNNWFGFGDAVDHVVGRVQDLGNALSTGWNIGRTVHAMNPLEAAIYAVGEALYEMGWDEAGKATQKFAKDLQKATKVGKKTAQAYKDFGFSDFTATVMGLSDALRELGWDGAADFFDRLGGAMMSAEMRMTDLLNRGINPLSAGLATAGQFIEDLTGLPVEQTFVDWANAIQRGVDAYKAYREQGINPVAAGIAALGETLAGITGNDDFLNWFGQAAQAAQTFGNAFEVAANRGLNPLHAALTGIATVIDEDLGRRMLNFADSLAAATEAAKAAGDSDFAATIRGWGDALSELTGIDITGLTDRLADFANAAGDFFAAIGEGDWSTVGDMLGDALGNIGDAIGSIDLGEVVVNIGSWALGQIADFAGFISDVVTGEGSGAGAELHGVLVNIASWALGSVASIGDFLNGLFNGGAGPENGDANGIGTNREGSGAAGAGANLNGVLVNILSWAAGEIADLGAWITDTAIPALGQIAADVASVMVNIGTWALGKVEDLASWFTSTVMPSFGQIAAEVAAVMVNVGTWAKGKMDDLGTWLTDTAIPAMGQIAAEVPKVLVSIGEWAVSPDGLNLSGLWDAITAAWEAPDVNMQADAEKFGQDIGNKIGEWLSSGINAALDALAGGGGAAQQSTLDRVLSEGPSVEFTDFINWGDILGSLVDGAVEGFDRAAGPALDRLVSSIGPAFERLKTEAWNAIKADLSKSKLGPSPIWQLLEEWLIGGVAEGGPAGGADQFGIGTNREMDTTFGGVTDAIVEGLLGKLQEVTEAVSAGLQQGLQELATSAQETIQTAADNFFQMIGDAFNAAFSGDRALDAGSASADPRFGGTVDGTGFVEQIVANFIEGLKGLPQKLADAISQIDFSAIPAALKDALSEAMSAPADGADALPEGVSALDMWLGGGKPGGFWKNLFGIQDASAAELPPEAQQEIADLGTQLGEQLASAIASPDFLDGVTAGLESQQATAFQGIGTALMTKIMEGIGVAMREPVTNFADSGTDLPGGGLAADLVNSLATQIETGMGAVDPSVFANVGAALMSKIQEGISAALSGGGGNTMGGPGERGGIGGSGQGMATSLVTSLVQSLTSGIQGADFSAVGEAIAAKLNEVMSTALSGGGGGLQGGMIDPAGSGGTGIGQSIVTSIVNSVTSADWSGLTTAFETKVQEAMTAFTTAITTGMTEAQTAVESGITAMTSSFQTLATEATTAGTEAGTGFATGMESGMSAAQAAAEAAVAAIQAILEGAAAGAEAAGAAVGAGFAAGIASQQGAVEAAAANLAAAAESAINSAAQIASPSKVTTRLGEFFGQGFILGILSQIQGAIAAARSLAESAVAGARSGTGGVTTGGGVTSEKQMKSIGSQIGQGFWRGMLDETPKTVEAAKYVIRRALDEAKGEAQKWSVRSRGHAMMARMFQDQLDAIDDPWANPDEFVKLQERIHAERFKAQTAAINATRARSRRVQERLDRAIKRGASKQQIRALRLEQRLLDQLARAQERAAYAPDGSAAQEIAQLRVKELQAKLSDLRGLDLGTGDKVAEDIGSGMDRAAQSTSRATNSMNKDLNSVGQTAQDVGQSVQDSFNGAGQAAQDAAGQVSGLQSGMDEIGKTLGDVGTASMDMQGAMEQLKSAMSEMGADFESLGVEAGSAYGTGMYKGIDTVTADILSSTPTELADISEKITALGDAMANVPHPHNDEWYAMADALKQVGAAALEPGANLQDLADQLAEVENHFANGDMGAAYMKSLQDAASAVGVLRGALEGLPAAAETAGSALNDAFSGSTFGGDLAQQAEAAGQEVGTAWGSGLDRSLMSANRTAEQHINEVRRFFEQVSGIGQQAGTQIGTGFANGLSSSNAPNAAQNLVNRTRNSLLTTGADAAQAANDAGLRIGNNLASGLGRSGQDAINTAASVNQRMNNTLNNSFGKINMGTINTDPAINKVKNAVDRIGGMASQAQRNANSVGASITAGLKAGLDQETGALYDKVREIVDKAIREAEREAQTASPSKRTTTIGEYLAQGLARGIDNDGHLAARSMAQMVHDLEDETARFDGGIDVGVKGDPELGRGDAGGRTVIVNQTFEFRDARFESVDDFVEFFDARAHESAISLAR